MGKKGKAGFPRSTYNVVLNTFSASDYYDFCHNRDFKKVFNEFIDVAMDIYGLNFKEAILYCYKRIKYYDEGI